jgi:Ca-activated chloride channel homolog
MMQAFHFIRPWWLLILGPWVVFVWYTFKQKPVMTAWSNSCDSHLLPYLMPQQAKREHFPLLWLLASLFFMIISLSGPTWSRLPVPTYKAMQPRVVLLDMSDPMLVNDLSPDRLGRAKFKLHDLFKQQDAGQFGLVAYTSEPFVVSPLTDDGQTIDALLSSLTPDVMPVEGQKLSSALEQGVELIRQAGFQQGELLVLSASPPSKDAMIAAKAFARLGIHTSIIPILSRDIKLAPAFQEFANAGKGKMIPFTDSAADVEQWLAATQNNQQYTEHLQNEIPIWRDQGRWFLIPALLFLLPAFRRGWIQRISA